MEEDRAMEEDTKPDVPSASFNLEEQPPVVPRPVAPSEVDLEAIKRELLSPQPPASPDLAQQAPIGEMIEPMSHDTIQEISHEEPPSDRGDGGEEMIDKPSPQRKFLRLPADYPNYEEIAKLQSRLTYFHRRSTSEEEGTLALLLMQAGELAVGVYNSETSDEIRLKLRLVNDKLKGLEQRRCELPGEHNAMYDFGRLFTASIFRMIEEREENETLRSRKIGNTTTKTVINRREGIMQVIEVDADGNDVNVPPIPEAILPSSMSLKEAMASGSEMEVQDEGIIRPSKRRHEFMEIDDEYEAEQRAKKEAAAGIYAGGLRNRRKNLRRFETVYGRLEHENVATPEPVTAGDYADSMGLTYQGRQFRDEDFNDRSEMSPVISRQPSEGPSIKAPAGSGRIQAIRRPDAHGGGKPTPSRQPTTGPRGPYKRKQQLSRIIDDDDDLMEPPAQRGPPHLPQELYREIPYGHEEEVDLDAFEQPYIQTFMPPYRRQATTAQLRRENAERRREASAMQAPYLNQQKADSMEEYAPAEEQVEEEVVVDVDGDWTQDQVVDNEQIIGPEFVYEEVEELEEDYERPPQLEPNRPQRNQKAMDAEGFGGKRSSFYGGAQHAGSSYQGDSAEKASGRRMVNARFGPVALRDNRILYDACPRSYQDYAVDNISRSEPTDGNGSFVDRMRSRFGVRRDDEEEEKRPKTPVVPPRMMPPHLVQSSSRSSVSAKINSKVALMDTQLSRTWWETGSRTEGAGLLGKRIARMQGPPDDEVMDDYGEPYEEIIDDYEQEPRDPMAPTAMWKAKRINAPAPPPRTGQRGRPRGSGAAMMHQQPHPLQHPPPPALLRSPPGPSALRLNPQLKTPSTPSDSPARHNVRFASSVHAGSSAYRRTPGDEAAEQQQQQQYRPSPTRRGRGGGRGGAVASSPARPEPPVKEGSARAARSVPRKKFSPEP